MHSALVNVLPPLIHWGAALSISLGAGITCTKYLEIHYNCSESFESPGFLHLFSLISDSEARLLGILLPTDDTDSLQHCWHPSSDSRIISGWSFHKVSVCHPFVIINHILDHTHHTVP